MLSKKYYIKFAEIFNENKIAKAMYVDDYTLGTEVVRQSIINDFIKYFKNDNSNFDADKFVEACNK